MSIVEGCPAFSDGCPFSKETVEKYPDALKAVLAAIPQETVGKCPAFKDGCPFKEDDSVEALYNHLSEMPPSHRMGQGEPSPAAAAVMSTFQMVHEASKSLKAKFDAPCPVFATSCPFKTLTSAGEPLVQELDVVLAQWGLADELPASPVLRAAAEPTSPTATSAVPLSKSLKAGTKSVHRAAENVQFVRDFLRHKVPRESYVELLRSLYFVYSAMETGIDGLPQELQHCDFRVLRRTEALVEDLCHFTGATDRSSLVLGTPSTATAQYVERLEYLAANSPFLLLAHAYTRYLGDLSGGQILARAASRAYDLPHDQGSAFYRFDLVGTSAADVKAFKKQYRGSLDALRLSALEADALVAEANQAFLMNILLFEERDVAAGHLDRVHSLEEVSSMVVLNRSPLQFQEAYAEKSGGGGKCPFLPAQGSDATTGGTCPWPFIWAHSPKTALTTHPVKNMGAALMLCGLAKAASNYPRSAGAALLVGAPVLWCLKPKKGKGHGIGK